MRELRRKGRGANVWLGRSFLVEDEEGKGLGWSGRSGEWGWSAMALFGLGAVRCSFLGVDVLAFIVGIVGVDACGFRECEKVVGGGWLRGGGARGRSVGHEREVERLKKNRQDRDAGVSQWGEVNGGR